MLAKCHYGLSWFLEAFVEVPVNVLAEESCYSVIAKYGTAVQTIGNKASETHRIPFDS